MLENLPFPRPDLTIIIPGVRMPLPYYHSIERTLPLNPYRPGRYDTRYHTLCADLPLPDLPRWP